jgi:CheY-like chemotaxis protein
MRVLRTKNITLVAPDEAGDGQEAVNMVMASLRAAAVTLHGDDVDDDDNASIASSSIVDGPANDSSISLPMRTSMRSQHHPAEYSAILMDYVMPVMDGPTATKRIRAIGYKGIIIGVTGNVRKEETEYFLNCGADYVMGKPLDIDRLEDLLHIAARRHAETMMAKQPEGCDSGKYSRRSSGDRVENGGVNHDEKTSSSVSSILYSFVNQYYKRWSSTTMIIGYCSSNLKASSPKHYVFNVAYLD